MCGKGAGEGVLSRGKPFNLQMRSHSIAVLWSLSQTLLASILNDIVDDICVKLPQDACQCDKISTKLLFILLSLVKRWLTIWKTMKGSDQP